MCVYIYIIHFVCLFRFLLVSLFIIIFYSIHFILFIYFLRNKPKRATGSRRGQEDRIRDRGTLEPYQIPRPHDAGRPCGGGTRPPVSGLLVRVFQPLFLALQSRQSQKLDHALSASHLAHFPFVYTQISQISSSLKMIFNISVRCLLVLIFSSFGNVTQALGGT